jgi:hypothetical protein
MRDNSLDITLAQGTPQGWVCCDHLLPITMSRNGRLVTKKEQKFKMECTHETSLGTPAKVTDAPKARRATFPGPEVDSLPLQSRFK